MTDSGDNTYLIRAVNNQSVGMVIKFTHIIDALCMTKDIVQSICKISTYYPITKQLLQSHEGFTHKQ